SADVSSSVVRLFTGRSDTRGTTTRAAVDAPGGPTGRRSVHRNSYAGEQQTVQRLAQECGGKAFPFPKSRARVERAGCGTPAANDEKEARTAIGGRWTWRGGGRG